MLACGGLALHGAVRQPVDRIACPHHLVGGGNHAAVLHRQVFVQRHQLANLPRGQQQGHVAGAIHRDVPQALAPEVVAGPLAAPGVVQNGGVIVDGQQGVGGEPAHPLGHAALTAHVEGLPLCEGEDVEVRLHLPAAGGDGGGGKPPAVRGKSHPQGGAIAGAHLPAQLLLQIGRVDQQLRHAGGGVGDDGQGAVVGHGAEEDAVFQRFGVQVLGAALHPQLVAGAVVEHKAGLARRQRRAGVAALDGVEPGARAGVHHAAVAAQLHKAARHGGQPGQLHHAGLLGPAGAGGQRDAGGIDAILHQRHRLAQPAGGHQHQRRQQRHQRHGAAHPLAPGPGLRCGQIFYPPLRERRVVLRAVTMFFHGRSLLCKTSQALCASSPNRGAKSCLSY